MKCSSGYLPGDAAGGRLDRGDGRRVAVEDGQLDVETGVRVAGLGVRLPRRQRLAHDPVVLVEFSGVPVEKDPPQVEVDEDAKTLRHLFAHLAKNIHFKINRLIANGGGLCELAGLLTALQGDITIASIVVLDSRCYTLTKEACFHPGSVKPSAYGLRAVVTSQNEGK